MRVSEAIALNYQAHTRPVEIQGKLIVSSQIICIVDHDAATNKSDPAPGILVPQGVLFQLDGLGLPLMSGSMVRFTGEITLKGTMTHTGLPPLPKCIPYVYEFSFSIPDFGSWHFVNGDTFKNLYLHAPNPVNTKTLAALKPLFPPQLTIMQLRALLASQTRHLLAEHVRGDAFTCLTTQIDEAGCTWQSEECLILYGGQP